MIYEFEDFRFDTELRELRCADEVRELEPQVMALLELLVSHPDRLISKDEIVETIWNGRIVSDGSINGRIKMLRKALDDDGKQQRLIKTVHGQGFRFVGLTSSQEPGGQDQPSTDALPLPEKPSIAVLPFDNMSNNPDHEFLADGICEDILTALSKIPQLFVIARNSTFTYKGKAVDIRQVGRELGVRYVLEGSVRSSGDTLRITAQLIDASNGNHIWADRYDRPKQDIFALQDEMTQQIVSQLLGELVTTQEQAKILVGGTRNFEAWQAVASATELMVSMKKPKIIEAQALLARALQADSGYSLAYVVLANTHFLQLIQGWSANPMESLAGIEENARKALEIDDTNSLAWAMRAFVKLVGGDTDAAYALAQKADALGPNILATINLVAFIYAYCCKYDEAEALCEHSVRLNPVGRATVSTTTAFVYTTIGKYEEAFGHAQDLLAEDPNNVNGLITAIIYHRVCEDDQASKLLVERLLKAEPQFSVEQYLVSKFLQDHESSDKSRAYLLEAGLPA